MQSPALAEPKEPAKKSGVKEAFEWIEMLACALVFVVFLFSFVFRVVTISGPSMNPSLWDGERVIVTDFFYTPRVGDIIVFESYEETGLDEPLIKRVIATGGQTVDINFDRGVVFVDGEQLDESYVNTPTNVSYDVQFPVTVPEGSVFCLGDNRNHSYDSRASEIGMIDERYVLGKVLWRIFPFHSIGNPDQ